MDAGVYEGMTFDDYAAIDAMNHTRLGWLMDESPRYFKHKLDTFVEYETRATGLGKAAHCATLQPDVFQTEYVMEPDPAEFRKPNGDLYASPRSCKAYNDVVADLTDKGLIVLKKEDYMLVCNIAKALRGHPRVGPLLESAKGTETTLVWKRDGLLCKARIDFWGPGWLADLKSTANFGGFSPWEVTKYSMHRQAAWYRHGADECGLDPEVNYLAAVSNDVHEVALFALERNALLAGKAENDAGWDRYRSCLDSGEWPGRYDENEVHKADISDRKYDAMFDAGVMS